MWANKAFRVWCFGSGVWIVGWVGVLIFADPFGGYMDPKELSAAWFIGAGPPAIGGVATYLYRRYIA